ncbi:hypothetical protein [Microbacterium sp. 179-I 3D4 NHS]|uniref:hypothetical protein n=1 Tax=Microbacterium sp. 179-I 3D4 NHS TaxID=3142381 RepID=UPI0039A07BD1
MNAPEPLVSDVLWACVEDGFHVGSRGGDFLGYVDRQADGHYLAFDARSQVIGAFLALNEATGAVVAASPARPEGGDGHEEAMR